jgi:hypothetical protein
LTVLMPEWDDRQRQRALQAFTEGLTEGHIAAAIRSTTGWHREESWGCVGCVVSLLTTLRHARFDFNQKTLKPIILI